MQTFAEGFGYASNEDGVHDEPEKPESILVQVNNATSTEDMNACGADALMACGMRGVNKEETEEVQLPQLKRRYGELNAHLATLQAQATAVSGILHTRVLEQQAQGGIVTVQIANPQLGQPMRHQLVNVARRIEDWHQQRALVEDLTKQHQATEKALPPALGDSYAQRSIAMLEGQLASKALHARTLQTQIERQQLQISALGHS